MLVSPSFHEHDIEDVGQMPHVFGTVQQSVDHRHAFVGGIVGKKFPHRHRIGNSADQVQVDPPDEFSVRCRQCGPAEMRGFHELVDLDVKRKCCLGSLRLARDRKQHETRAQDHAANGRSES
jgi:hypothetical protein